MTAFVVILLISAALYYLGSWALVTQWLWIRYPPRLARLAACPSCSGFWYGAIVAGLNSFTLELPFLELRADAWSTPLIVGLCTLVTTPLIARALLEANERVNPSPVRVDDEFEVS